MAVIFSKHYMLLNKSPFLLFSPTMFWDPQFWNIRFDGEPSVFVLKVELKVEGGDPQILF